MPKPPIQLKRSGTATATPASLGDGELAINYADNKIFWKDASDAIQSFTFQSYALATHTHAASDVTSGTFDAARLPLATTGAAGAIIVGTGLGVSSGTVSVTYGTNSTSACRGDDSRLSDTRTPTDGSVTTAKIADANVTYAKLQNVSATDRLLGRSSAGAGDVEEITCTSFGRALLDDTSHAAQLTTLGAAPLASPTFTGTVTVPGLTATAAILADDLATTNSVVYAFDGDPNCGIGRAGADILTFVTAGAERVRIDASGNVVVGPQGTGSAVSAPIYLQLGRQVADTAGTASKTKLRTYEDSGGNIFGFGVSSGLFETHVSTGASFAWYVNNTERFRISSGGTVTAAQVYSDTVGGTNRDLFIDNTGKLGYVSSIRASKTNIESIDDVSWLRNLTPVSFHYRKRNEDGTYSDEADGTRDYGLIAEDVEPVAPEMCFYDVVDGEPQLRGVHYSKLITPMLKYIQQLEQRIAALEERLNHA